jgi:predicted NUDIX family phosphoesterase
MKKEQVLAIRTSSITPKHGLSLIPDELSLDDIFDSKDVLFASRAWLEDDEQYLQIIPYCLVKHQDKYLTYSRTKQAGEAKLHGKVSCGFGGHVNIVDAIVPKNADTVNITETIAQGAYRELREELFGEFKLQCEVIGLLYDPADAVGRVHLGVVIECETDSDGITSPDEGITILGFRTKEELLNGDYELEGWTRITLSA